jgi:hypothetical protein
MDSDDTDARTSMIGYPYLPRVARCHIEEA